MSPGTQGGQVGPSGPHRGLDRCKMTPPKGVPLESYGKGLSNDLLLARPLITWADLWLGNRPGLAWSPTDPAQAGLRTTLGSLRMPPLINNSQLRPAVFSTGNLRST